MKIRGTTITTPIPKSVYTLHWSQFNGWGENGFDYDGALNAFRQGKIVVLRISHWQTGRESSFICVDEMMTDIGLYRQEGLLFIGMHRGDIEELRLYPDGTWIWDDLLYDIEQNLNTLKTGFSQLPFKALTGTTGNPVVIRNLESGVYLLNGKVKNISTASTSNAVNDFYLVSNNGAKSYVIKFATSLHAVHQYILTDTTSTFNQCRLDQILDRLANLENNAGKSAEAKYVTRLPDSGEYIGQIVLVDPSGESSADTEAWMYLGFDMNMISPRWNRISFDKDNMYV